MGNAIHLHYLLRIHSTKVFFLTVRFLVYTNPICNILLIHIVI